MAEKRYSAADIRVLEGLEPVRVRPGMYVGGTNTRALHHLLWEVVDNAVDEALAGRCSTIRVELTDDEVVTVTDDGRGIPVDVHPEQGVSALELVFTKLHAGGKFGDGGYKVSGGLHGVGASVTNALSDWLEVEVRRDKRLWRQRYRRGVPDGPVEDVRALEKGEGTGTRVRFTPDRTIFDRNAHFSATTVQQRLREKSFLVRGLTFELRGPDGAEHVYRSEEGLADYVRELNESREPAHPGVVSLSGESGGIPIEIALQWTNAAEDRLYGFCNVVNTVDGGTHVSGLRRALTRVLNQAAYDAGRLKKDKGETLDAKDVADGLTGAVSVMLEDPQFEGQTKGRLNNQEAQTAVAAFAGASLAGSDAMQTGWEAVRFGWVAYIIPFLFVAAPSLLLDGTPVAITIAILTSLFGVWMVSAAVVGYFRRPLSGPMRGLFVLAGIMMFLPAGAIPYGHWVDAAGVVLGVILTVREYMAGKGAPAPAVSAGQGSAAG